MPRPISKVEKKEENEQEEEEEKEDFTKIHSPWPPAFQHRHIFSQFFLWCGVLVIRVSACHTVTESILINQKTTDV